MVYSVGLTTYWELVAVRNVHSSILIDSMRAVCHISARGATEWTDFLCFTCRRELNLPPKRIEPTFSNYYSNLSHRERIMSK